MRFCESDSHEDILVRLGWPDSRPLETRGWVRVECVPDGDGWKPVRADETSVPGWYAEDRPRYEGLVLETATRVRQAREAYEATKRQAWDAYMAVERPARDAYEAAKHQARDAYEAVERPARDAYEAVERPAWDAYDAAKHQAWDAYEATKRQSWDAYAQRIGTITGYVPELA